MGGDVDPISAVEFLPDPPRVRILDQTALPGEERYLELDSLDGVAEAIRTLRVRGAPAIGIAAAYGLAMQFNAPPGTKEPSQGPEVLAAFEVVAGVLAATRPTAVNLPWALDRLRRRLERWVEDPGDGRDPGTVLLDEARAIHHEDREACGAIGRCWDQIFPVPAGSGPVGVLTHCNAGALATGGMGTALAPVYAAHAQGVNLRVHVGETRPLQQGGRLTAWELTRVGIPVAVTVDSAVGALMARGRVNLVIVGADRVAANGDVANKIGTYSLAVLAREHGLPFYVALPSSTFDPATRTGLEIPVEERSETELRGTPGQRAVPESAGVWNPAFDITPAHLVTAFLTPSGVVRPPFGPSIQAITRSFAGPASGSERHE
jgi:methylthioribose-1-phosphate isomerase